MKAKYNYFELRRAKMERENHDLTLEQIRLKASEQRATQLQNVK